MQEIHLYFVSTWICVFNIIVCINVQILTLADICYHWLWFKMATNLKRFAVLSDLQKKQINYRN